MGPDQQHAVLRTLDQWQSLLHPDLARAASQNARNASLPDPEKIETMLDRFIESLDFVIEALDPHGLHDDHVPPTVQHVVTTTRTAVQHNLPKATSTSPQCTADLLSAVDDFLCENDLCGSVWDKNLSSLGGFCQSIVESHVQTGILANTQFDIRGVSPTYWQCKGMALHLLLDSAE